MDIGLQPEDRSGSAIWFRFISVRMDSSNTLADTQPRCWSRNLACASSASLDSGRSNAYQ
jgi:hypothetical protein